MTKFKDGELADYKDKTDICLHYHVQLGRKKIFRKGKKIFKR